MIKTKKMVSFLLVFVLVLALLPITAYALPRTFDKSRVRRLDDYLVTLTIGDMTFEGKFTNAKLTDEKLEELVKKVLDEMGLSEADFDLLNDMINTMNEHESISQAQMESIFGRWFDALGMVPGIGSVASFVQILLQLSRGDRGGALQNAAEEAGGQFLEGLGEGLSSSELWGKLAGSAFGVGKGLLSIILGALESGSAGDRAIDRALGLEAYRIINEFYAKLNREVEKFYEEEGPTFKVVFDNAKAPPKAFSLFTAQYTETWTLNMTLFQEESYNRLDIDGKYGGQYTIEIVYDLSKLPLQIRNMGEIGERLTTHVESQLDGPFDITVESKGADNVIRTLEGYATAFLYRKGGNCAISPEQQSDKARVEDFSVIANLYGIKNLDGEGTMELNYDIEFTIDDVNVYLNVLKNMVTLTLPEYHNVTDGPLAKGDIPLDDDIWKRGDKAGNSWKISLTPLHRK